MAIAYNGQAFPTPLRFTGDCSCRGSSLGSANAVADSVSEGSVGGSSLSFRPTAPCGNAVLDDVMLFKYGNEAKNNS